MNFHCVKCDIYFNNSIGLRNHLNKSKEHNDINILTIKCSFCNKEYNKPYLHKRHETSCKEKTEYEYKIILSKYKELKLEYDKLSNEFNTYKIEEKEKYDIIKEEKDIIKTKYDIMKEKYDTAMEINNNKQTNPSIIINDNSIINTNNGHIGDNIMAIANSFKPLTTEFLENQLSNISSNRLASSGSSYIITHSMRHSDIGKNLIVTDPSRNSIVYKDKHEKIIRDKNSELLIKDLIDITSEQDNLYNAIDIVQEKIKTEIGTTDFNKVSDIHNQLMCIKNKDPENKLNSKLKKSISKLGSSIDMIKQLL